MRSIVLLLLFILSAFSANASDKVLPAGNKTLLVLGDSLSAGYGVDLSKAWVSLLQTKLKQSNYNINVVNASVSGETSQGGLSRIKALLQQHKPDLVIVELGANDGLRGLPIDAMKSNLQSIIQQCRDTKAQVLLLGMRLPPNYGPAYTKAFASAYHELTQANQVALVDFFLQGIADQRNLMQADDLHPNQQAQPMILHNVWPALLPLLNKSAPR